MSSVAELRARAARLWDYPDDGGLSAFGYSQQSRGFDCVLILLEQHAKWSATEDCLILLDGVLREWEERKLIETQYDEYVEQQMMEARMSGWIPSDAAW